MKVFSETRFGRVTSVEMGYAPFCRPMMTARIYLLDDVLIDTGVKHCQKEVLAYLDEHPISAVYLTHHHEDHSGNAAAIKQRYHVPIMGHPVTVEKMASPLSVLPYQHYMWGAAEAVKMDLLPETVETEHFSFTPVHTPGHSRDHTAYWEPNQGWLFSGDLYLADKIKYFRADEDFKDQVDSLRKALAFDFESLFCAHNPKLKNGRQYLQRKLDFLTGIREQVALSLKKGLTVRQMMEATGIKESPWIRFFCGGNVKAEFIIQSAIHSISPEFTESSA